MSAFHASNAGSFSLTRASRLSSMDALKRDQQHGSGTMVDRAIPAHLEVSRWACLTFMIALVVLGGLWETTRSWAPAHLGHYVQRSEDRKRGPAERGHVKKRQESSKSP